MSSVRGKLPATKKLSELPNSISLTIPMLPPTVNHYVKHTRSGRHYVTAEAKAYKQAVALISRRQSIKAKAYRLSVEVYLGHKDRGDIDNFAKVVIDSLVEAGVIHSDAAVMELNMKKHRATDKQARTEITVEAIEQIKRVL